MKREIVCDTCYPDLRGLYATDAPYEGEHTRFVRGLLRETTPATEGVLCDQCGEPVAPGDVAWAFSSWADYGGQPYAPWEDEYLDGGEHVPAGEKPAAGGEIDEGIRVVCYDAKTGEQLDEKTIRNDYLLLTHGTCQMKHTQVYSTGTCQITLKKEPRPVALEVHGE